MKTSIITNDLLVKLVEICRPLSHQGKLPSYIPALMEGDPTRLGVAIALPDGTCLKTGDALERFSIQSVSKVFTLAVALHDAGEELFFSRIGKEPTGDPFNSIVRLESDTTQKPYNPMINAGAIAACALVAGNTAAEKFDRILDLIRTLGGNYALDCNSAVYLSERESGNRNRSLAYFLKDIGALDGDVEMVLEVYFRQCAIAMNCAELARSALILALGGLDPQTGAQLISHRIANIAKTFMFTCGLYQESGEFALAAGIPAKSGVGGGIMAVVPGRMGIAVFGPALDERGNSLAGKKLLENLSSELNLSIMD